jgi:hypothetical protein
VLHASGLHDAHGAALAPFEAPFTTTTAAQQTPSGLQALHCASDERELAAVGCALLGDDRVGLRLQLTAAACVHVSLGEALRSRLAGPEALEFDFAQLAPDHEYALSVELDAGDGPVRVLQQLLSTRPALPTLSISEVLADPLGDETSHEFVEIWNFGGESVALDGISLADDGEARPNPIATGLQLAPRARALLVSDSFDPSGDRDVPPAPGCLLLRVGTNLTRGGLANGGEALFLRGAAGDRLSAAPAAPTPRAGICSERGVDDPRTGATGSFHYAANGCSPGR